VVPFDVLVLGSANIDHCIAAPRLPRPGETIIGSRYFTAFGGKGANQAVAAARMGARTALIGRVGDDAPGQAMLDNLSANGVVTQYVARDTTNASGSAYIIVAESGQNQIIVIPGANMAVSPSDVDRSREAFRNARVLLLQMETPDLALVAAAEAARAAGVLVVLDPAPVRPIPPELYRLLDFVAPNETEALALTGVDVDDLTGARRAAEAFASRGVRIPVIKLGPRGALALSDGEAIHSPALSINPVDTTAAGDAFAGALASSLAQGLDLRTCLSIANTAGGLACTRFGAMPSLPYAHEVSLARACPSS